MTSPQTRQSWQAVDGLLLLDKPSGLTSNAALQRARRALQAARAGHTGTLDPLASGLLPLCFGQATRFAGYLLDADKGYRAQLRLGITTTTGDAEGAVLERRAVAVDVPKVTAVLACFLGDSVQTPPMHSALKVAGKPLYAYARAGETVKRAVRPVQIHRLELLALQDALLTIDVVCSKGTYIRVLAEDIGAALGCGAHLQALRRTSTSGWTLEQAVSLEQFEAASPAQRQAWLRPPAALLQHLPQLRLDAAAATALRQGKGLQRPDLSAAVYCASADDGALLGLVEVGSDGRLRARRLMSTAVSDDRHDSAPAGLSSED